LATAKYKSTANIKAGFGGISSPPLSVTVNWLFEDEHLRP
jgi:hypothetical protein